MRIELITQGTRRLSKHLMCIEEKDEEEGKWGRDVAREVGPNIQPFQTDSRIIERTSEGVEIPFLL